MDAPLSNLKMLIVIPCLAESGIGRTLEALRQNIGYDSSVECLIVVNHSEAASSESKAVNTDILETLLKDKERLDLAKIKFIPIKAFDLPVKKAGVGLARKTGMDLAVVRLKQAGNFKEGIIICLDGDCTVSKNYLSEIEKYFAQTKANGCSIYFEHPLDGENSTGIIDYELFLRYYTDALRWCGFPYAYQTVGSSMAVSAEAYEKQGGMNTRQAGEDFYFLNKIIQLEQYGDLTTTTVYPSPRQSERVPFGTGREMMEWERTQQLLAYHPDLFIELKKILSVIDQLRDCNNAIGLLKEHKIHSAFITWLEVQELNKAVMEAQMHTASLGAFRKRFFVWMNAFRIMKMLNELSLSNFQKELIYDCASWLWQQISSSQPALENKSLLLQYRELDRRNPKWI
jgi:hypothetical protein